MTSGFVALSGHVDVAERADRQQVLVDLHRTLTERFDIDHVTLQVETGDIERALGQPCLPGSANCFAGPIGRAVRLPVAGSEGPARDR